MAAEPLDPGDGLTLRRACLDDSAELVEFNATMHADTHVRSSALAQWTRDLFDLPHPTFRAERDVTVVEDTASGRIVSPSPCAATRCLVAVAARSTTMTGMGRPSLQWTTVCVDCADAERLADFYCRLLGWQVAARDGHGWVQVGDPQGGVGLNFQSEDWYQPPTWPEQPAEQTKMLHFEILVDDIETAVAHATAAGATVAPHQPLDRDQRGLRVMLDPAGHPFCLFVEGE